MDNDLKDIRARYASARPKLENPALVRTHADVVNLLAAYDALATELAKVQPIFQRCVQVLPSWSETREQCEEWLKSFYAGCSVAETPVRESNSATLRAHLEDEWDDYECRQIFKTPPFSRGPSP